MNDELNSQFKNIKKNLQLSQKEKDFHHEEIIKFIKDREYGQPSILSTFNIFSFNIHKITVGVFIALIVFGGAGVVAASNSSGPGDFLFPMDLALEKIQIKFSEEEKKTELRLKFVRERILELDEVSEPSDDSSINFSERKIDDIVLALTEIDGFLNSSEDGEDKDEISESLDNILTALADDGKLEILREDGHIKVKNKDDEVKIEVKEDEFEESSDEEKNKGNSENKNDNLDDQSNDDLINGNVSEENVKESNSGRESVVDDIIVQ